MGRTSTLIPPGENKKSPRRAEKTRMWKLGITAKIIAVIFAAAVCVGVGVLVWAIAGYDKIYPGISSGGVDLSGLTVTEARQALESEISRVFDGASVTLTVDDVTEVITAQEVGAGFSAEDAAQSAYDMGRSEGIFDRAFFVATSPFTGRETEPGEGFYLDNEAVSSRVSKLGELVNTEPVQYSWNIEPQKIQVRSGQAGRSLDEDALTNLVVESFLTRSFTSVSAETVPIEPEPLHLQTIYDSVHSEPKDAILDTSEPGEPKIAPHADGVSFDMAEAERLSAAGGDFSIPLIITPPAITQPVLESRLFKDVLSSFSTNLSSATSDRTHNIRLSASIIDGTILLPGEVFSYNETVGERTSARGFKGAGAYVNGRLVDEIGGGICQMSSTIYNSALLADLKIVERQNHSMTVGYLSSGLDATVNWGSIDLKFENSTGYPIKIHSSVEGTKVLTSITGFKNNDHNVEMERDVLSYSSYSEVVKVNDALAPGARKVTMDGHNGTSVQTYRVIKDSAGNVVSRTAEAKSTYRKVDRVVEVGPKAVPAGPGTDPTPSPESPSSLPSSLPTDSSPSPSLSPPPDSSSSVPPSPSDPPTELVPTPEPGSELTE